MLDIPPFTALHRLTETTWHRTYPERPCWACADATTQAEWTKAMQVTLEAIQEDWIEQIPMDEETLATAEKVASELGYQVTCLSTTSSLKGLVCKPHHHQHMGERWIINTRQFGLMVVGDLHDYQLAHLIPNEDK